MGPEPKEEARKSQEEPGAGGAGAETGGKEEGAENDTRRSGRAKRRSRRE